MDEKQILGGSVAALAAHSKDASVPGPTPASSETGDESGVTVDQAAARVREKPMIALFSAGVAGMVLGVLLTRR